MKNISPLSQNNPQWKNTKLGYGDVTIGGYGCLITAIACLARLDDPRKVNDILKENSGFVNEQGGTNMGTYVVWNAVSKIPGLTFKYRYYSYDNELVKKIIDTNGGCIIEVDGSPIGGYRHWLLYIGNGQLIDTWDGKVKPTTSYTPISFVDIEYKEGTNMDALTECLNQHSMLVTKCNDKDKEIEELKSQIKDKDKTISEKDVEIAKLQPLVTEMNKFKASGYGSTFMQVESFILDLQRQIGDCQSSTPTEELPEDNNDTTENEECNCVKYKEILTINLLNNIYKLILLN